MLLPLLLACAPADPDALSGSTWVFFDPSGVPHVYADSERDAFWMQGWLAARDRLFQMDMTRRRAQGRRAELLGEERYLSDVQARALRFAEWGEATAARLPQSDPRVADILDAYADGVNAWLEDAIVGRGDASLPPQIEALDYVPEPWTPADSMAIEKMITAGLSMRPDQELTLGLMRLLVGQDLFHDVFVYEPFDADVIAPTWLAEAREAGLLEQASDATAGLPPVDLEGIDPRALGRAMTALDLGLGGSNNQAIDAAHSASGHALILGDSHQGVAHPATYWLVHLNTTWEGGTLDVAGATFPGAPLVMFGTNGRVAWTPTTSLLDVSDVWLETWSDASQTAVMHDGEAVPVDWRDEVITVRTEAGVEERTVPLATVPHHGPILPAESLGLPLPVTVSIGWTGYRPDSTARTYLELAEAQDLDEALAAFDGYFTGGQNWLIGDTSGRVAWTARVDLPTREVLDPEQPPLSLLPGGGTHDWVAGDGLPYLPTEAGHALQRADPEEGFLVSANNDPVGQTLDGDPFNDGTWLSGVFDIGTRSFQPRRRLQELLAVGPITVDDARSVQLDTTSRLAEVLLPFLDAAAAARPDLLSPESTDLLGRLQAWDRRCPTDAVEPSIFHLWLMLAARDMMADEAGGLVGELVFSDMSYQLGLVAVKHLRYWLQATEADLARIESGELPFPSRSGLNLFDRRDTEAVETRDELLLSALSSVIPEATRIFGSSDPATWSWGAWHQMALIDAADTLVPEASAPPQPKSGGLYTVDVGDFSWFVDGQIPDQLLVTNAPSNRFIFELDPAGVRALIALPGGQDERPGARHHNDLFEPYLAGAYAALPLERSEVEAAAVEEMYRE